MRVNFAWDANTEPGVIGYKIYAGRATGDYDDDASPKDVGNVLTGYYDVFEWGWWYFALTAYTATEESEFSAEIQTYVAPIQLSIAAQNSRLNALETAIGASAILKLRSGAQPANCAASDSGTVLATLNLPSDWLSNAATATKAKLGTWEDLAGDAAGTAAHFRIYANDGVTCHVQGSVTATAGGGDLTLNDVAITTGKSIVISSFSFADNNT